MTYIQIVGQWFRRWSFSSVDYWRLDIISMNTIQEIPNSFDFLHGHTETDNNKKYEKKIRHERKNMKKNVDETREGKKQTEKTVLFIAIIYQCLVK